MNQTITRSPKVYNPAPEQKTNNKFSKLLLTIIIFIIIALGLVYLAYYSNVFNIQNVLIDGRDMPEIQKSITGKNLIFLNTTDLKKQITTQYPNVGEINIVRGIPNTIKIKISEYEPKIIWQTNGKNYLVNDEGRAFRQISEDFELPSVIDDKDLAIEVNQQVVSRTFIDFVTNFNKKMLEDLDTQILYFKIESTIFQANAYTNKGWYLKLDTTRSPDDQIGALKELLKEHQSEINQYADLRVEGKVYYK